MKRFLLPGLLIVLALSAVGFAYLQFSSVDPAPPHVIGTFTFDDGEQIVFVERPNSCLRYVFIDGRAGLLCRSDNDLDIYTGASHLDGSGPQEAEALFEDGSVVFTSPDQPGRPANQVSYLTHETVFRSDETELVGQLLMPPGEIDVPLVIHVSGSGRNSAIATNWIHHFLAANGVASFVYDKRGTGGSGGDYTQDFDQLARDASAAAREARRVLDGRTGPVGMIGYSQGGWVAPLAATHTTMDFLIVAYGLAVSPAAEERTQIAEMIRQAGHGEETVALAERLADATTRLADTDFAEGEESFRALQQQAENEGWLEDISGDGVTSAFSRYPLPVLRLLWPFFDVDTPWNHDAEAVLASLDIPQLWLLGAQDREAPSAETLAVLRTLAGDRDTLEIHVFAEADHGMIERSVSSGQTSARFVPGYIERVVTYALRQ